MKVQSVKDRDFFLDVDSSPPNITIVTLKTPFQKKKNSKASQIKSDTDRKKKSILLLQRVEISVLSYHQNNKLIDAMTASVI